jgi:DNA helicase-2/ATP-dependent DNA helicase PcrA
MDEAALLEGLDGAQREAVLTDASPLVILAPAGSGKTRVVSHRIARRVLDGSADAQHVLAITFTRRAAGELQRRLGRLGLRGRPTAGTFHGVAWAVLTQRWSDQRRARPELLTDRVRLLETAVGHVVPTRRIASVHVEAVASELDWARARLVTAEHYAEEARRGGRKPPLPPDLLAAVFSAYADEKHKRRVVDFDDLLELCATELDHPDFAASQRWRFRHLFVDEFQDVNPLQFRLLEAWRGGRPDLCVVGDPNQAIYGWNGADPSLLLRLPSLVGGATVVRLDRSYRSTPQVLTTAAALLPRGEAPAPVRADGPAPEVHGFATEHDEARAIAALLAERRPGRRWSSCAVLVRTRAQVGVIERALRHASIPVRIRHDRPLLDLPGVQAALRQGESAEPLGNVLEELEHRLATSAAEAAPGEAEPAGLRQLCSLGRELLSASPSSTLGTFRAWLAAGGADVADGVDAVDVLTFHAAKGLEWPLVVVAGVEAGLVPHHSATGIEGRAEETRLLYVALTRAEHELHCTWARARGRDGRRERKPSPLLERVRIAATPPPAAPPPWDRQPAGAGDPPVLTALRQWRAHSALAADVPEHAVCSDDQLSALAAVRPTTLDELAGVLGPVAARRLAPRLLPVLGEASG